MSCRKVLLTLFFIATLFLLFYLLSHESPVVDYIQYWSAAQLFVSGDNPYDPLQISALEWSVWGSNGDPILMWNPPLIFPLIVPLAWCSFFVGRFLWLVGGVGAFFFAYHLLSRLSPLSLSRGNLALRCVLVVSFFPMLLSLYDGQLSPILVVGLALYLAYSLCPRPRTFIAGLGLSLTFLKPHLLFLNYAALFVRFLRGKDIQLVGGVIAGVVLLIVLPLLIRPDIYTLYSAALHEPPLYFKTPTLGSYLQQFFGEPRAVLRFAPTILALIIFIPIFFIKRTFFSSLQGELLLIPISLLTSPYGWVYDHLLLLPVLLFIVQKAEALNDRLTLYLLLALNLFYCFSPAAWGQQLFLWYPVGILLLYVRLLKRPLTEVSALR